MHRVVASPTVNLKQYDAILLAGGQSRRLKTDKLHLELAHGRVLAHLVDLCRDLFRCVFLITDRPGRIPAPHPDVRMVADEIPGSGPLGGLLSGLRASSSDRCFVTACDLPFLHPELIRFLARRIGNQDVLVPARGDFIEPLVGFYSKGCCEAIRRRIDDGDLRIRGFWTEVRTEIVELDGAFDAPDLRTWLLNINTRHDLEIAEAVAASESWR
ncbi:MAG: molybdenum cofactor guanylyltransferase [Candidatus Eisenbacteria sp.]|nr:molybdenum cofactor guanylyltransferase [Candidatus Eisenbacteria bacterium]